MANAFQHGDIVVLKSGGPPMTIDAVPGEEKYPKKKNDYLCRWFKGATEDKGIFGEHLIKKYEPPKK